MQVAHKTQQMRIKRTDAILEVYTDHIIEKKSNIDEALLWVTKHAISEFSVCNHIITTHIVFTHIETWAFISYK